MKILTLEDYQRAGEHFWSKVRNMLPKNLVKVPRQKTF